MRSARELLGPKGPFAAGLIGYEHRPGQLAMADAVERALVEDRIVLCEAGTGTGKTLAYLLPALASNRKVVVSTASKALQEQIFFKDLPLIAEYLGQEIDAVMVKGLGNYLCRRRFAELQLTASVNATAAIRRALPVVSRWAEGTSSGDVAELEALPETHPIWKHVTSSSESRIGQRCPHFESCHVTKLKRAAERAQLLIVNHHLLFADLAIKATFRGTGGALPEYDALIVDEAHKVEDIASGFFGVQVSSTRFDTLARDARRVLQLDEARTTLADRLVDASRRFFGALSQLAVGDVRTSLSQDAWAGDLLAHYHTLDDLLEALSTLGSSAPVDGSEALRQIGTRAQAIRDDLARLAEHDSGAIRWLERRGTQINLVASPVDVGPILRERMFDRGIATVFTSATLRADDSFDYTRSRIGLAEPHLMPVDEVAVESAFDFASQSRLYLPTDLPAVDDPNFDDAAAERTAELIRASGGGAFVLCTSLRSMRALAAGLKGKISQSTLVQGEAPKHALLDRFRKDGNAVLVATMSFWEGVDVPGRALRLVVIDRIPFAVPTDPLVVARCEAIRAKGEQPFRRFSLPQAALVLKQGFGRLIRSKSDRGVVTVLDGRLRKKGYGKLLLRSLPETTIIEDMESVRSFYSDNAG
ncbi:ATP-dependent DNA helicase [Endomicrobium sp. AH-315-J14]|nr:ATP-dependent DNA helicase [Endomicrobium sp. AH-315-J14]